MPFGYSGSKDPKKSRKDGTRGSSAASAQSHSSHSTGKGLNPFGDKSKKENSTPSQSRAPSTGSAAKPRASTRSPVKSSDADKKDTGVFDFLEEEDDDDDESEESSSSSEDDDEDPVGAQPKTTIMPGTIGLQLAKGNKPHGAPALQPSLYNENQTLKKDASQTPQDKKDSDFSTMPETFYTQRSPAPAQRPSFPPSPPKSPEESHPKKQQTLRKTHNTKPKKIASGYGFIAPRIKASPSDSKERLPPLYRRFEHLNHRVLLHLQDEIAEMEEDLQTLDELEEGYRSSTAEREKNKTASRRLDAQAQSSSTLHSRRQILMEMLIQKTEQYNNALYAYTRVIQNLPRASEPDIKTYRTWMKERKPIAPAEARFLNHDQDLISITPHASSSAITSKSSSPSIFPAIVIASASILLPLLAFSMVSEFTGRLVLVAIVGGAASAVAGNYSTGTEQLVDPKDGWRCATIYFGFMTVAAMFIP